MNTLNFRVGVKPQDLARIEEITRSTGFFEEVEGENECAVEDARDSLEAGAEKSGSEYMFAELDGEVVGFVSYGPVALTENSWFMYWLSVHESCRGKGVGRKLITHALNALFERGARKVFLQTSARPQYLPTRMFYPAVGFKQEGVLEDYYKEGEATVFFSITKKDLEAKRKI